MKIQIFHIPLFKYCKIFRKIYSVASPIVCYCGIKEPSKVKKTTEREMTAFQCLAGYIITTLQKEIKKLKEKTQ